MKVTVNKIVWVVSFIIFLVVAYNMNTFERLWDIFSDQQSSTTIVNEYNPFVENVRSDSLKNLSIEEGIEDILGEVEGIRSSVSMSDDSGVTREVEKILSIENDLYLKVERLKWEIEKISETIDNIEIKIARTSAENNTTADNFIAIMGALTPLLLPIIASKFKGNTKKINLRKKT